MVNLTDAIFQPLAACQMLNSRRADIQTAKNDALLTTAEAYFQVHQYRGMCAGLLFTVEKGHELVDRITRLSKDLVRPIEIERAKTLLADLEQEGLQQTTRFGDELTPVFRPQEVVYALRLMKVAFDEYFTTVAEYNLAQFQLFHALGYPAQNSRNFARPAISYRSTRHAPTTCPRLVTDRRRRSDKAIPSLGPHDKSTQFEGGKTGRPRCRQVRWDIRHGCRTEFIPLLRWRARAIGR